MAGGMLAQSSLPTCCGRDLLLFEAVYYSTHVGRPVDNYILAKAIVVENPSTVLLSAIELPCGNYAYKKWWLTEVARVGF